MSLGDEFSEYRTIVIVVGKNRARRQNCAISRRKAKWGVGEILCQSMHF